MKKTVLLFAISLSLFACNSNKQQSGSGNTDSVLTAQDNPVDTVSANHNAVGAIDWNTIPDLKDIGSYPFITAPKGLKIETEKNGLTEHFEYEKLENYLGNDQLIKTEGKLGVIVMEMKPGYNDRYFDKNVYGYLDKIGAKILYSGPLSKEESVREKLKENMYSGVNRTTGTSDDQPVTVYAFRNQGKNYIINVQSNSAQGTIFIMELEAFEGTIKKYTATEIGSEIDKTGKAVLYINFDTDKATLKPEGKQVADEIANLLNENTGLKISIEGYTDNTGLANRNVELSKERAQSVMKYLIEKGAINPSRLKAAGYGAEKPISPNDSEENKAKNRRVELVKIS